MPFFRSQFVSKSVSQQRYPSHIFGIPEKTQSERPETDYFPCLIAWLSNILTLLGHLRSSEFQAHVTSVARRADITSALQECVGCMEETVNFLFQQAVYTVTKALYNPINSMVNGQRVDGSTCAHIEQVLNILKVTHYLADSLLLHKDVTKQLMAYLLFFLSTTLFNRVIMKGSQLYNKDFGSTLQADLTKLETWAGTIGLTSELNSFSEHLMSLTDLLASSKRSLMRLDWEGFQRQFSPLSDSQLCKVLSEYNLGEGTPTPTAWYPHYAVDAKEDLTLSLSAHPQFNIPKEAAMVSLSETFPPAFFRRLEQVQHKFSLVGEDAYYSGLSSAGNTPRLSESMTNGQKAVSTFFLQDSMASSQQLKTLLSSASRKARASMEAGISEGSDKPLVKGTPPTPPPKPVRSLGGETRQVGNGPLIVQQQSQSLLGEQQLQSHHQYRHQQQQQQPSSSLQQQSQHQHHQPHQHHHLYDDSSHSHRRRQHSQHHPNMNSNTLTSVKDGFPDTVTNTTSGLKQENQHPPGPPPYNMVMKNRRRSGEGSPAPAQPQSQPLHQPSMWSNHQNKTNKPHAHAAILKHGTEDGPQDINAKAPYAHAMHNIQTLPDFRDKATWRSSSHQHPPAKRDQRYLRPALKSQRSWANHQRFEAEPSTSDLASSYPLMRPRPSSATECETSEDLSQREHFMRLRSNSALGNKSRHAQSAHAPFVQPSQNYPTQQHNNTQLGQNYEHIKDSTNNSNPVVSFKPNAGNVKYSHRREDLSKGSSSNAISNRENGLSLTRHSNRSCPGLLRSSRVDLSDPDSADVEDVPPPLPPKGEYLLRWNSMGSQNSLESSGHGRARIDSDPYNVSGSSTVSVRVSSGRTGGGSRASVEIQDVADHLIYNPNLPVQDMLDHNQNCFKMESRNIPSNLTRQKSSDGLPSSTATSTNDACALQYQRATPHIPPLELPDDLLAVSDIESPVDTFNKLSSRLPSDSTTSSFQSDKRQNFPSGSNLVSPAISGSGSNLAIDASHSSVSSDKYPDDIYVDVPEGDVDSSGSAASLLKVLPVEDKSRGPEPDPGVVAVRYRHAMPESRDIATNGKVTGEVFSVSLNKAGSKLGMGLIDGLHTPLKQAGIYVRNVLPDTPAALCGAIRVGDRILAVNGKSIVGADYQSAMVLIRSTGPQLELLVAKCDRSVASKISASAT
ncbi:Ras suppressor protein 1 [Elysia marginata]|uniref:Ras suppressor protein 1 n=1 Tax=Elysia marginata TaxID=1093978 RepID=A0AAV4IVM8_9GAST|nr:Ras suppressor protein 1 [Elysia marginata]